MTDRPFLEIQQQPFRGRPWSIALTRETLLVMLTFLPDGTRVLLRQARPGISARVVGPPMGTFAPASLEHALSAARTEAEYETGFEIERIRLLFSTYRSPGLTNQQALVYAAFASGKTVGQVVHSDEDFEVVLLPAAATLEDMRVRFSGDHFDAAVWYYFLDLGEDQGC